MSHAPTVYATQSGFRKALGVSKATMSRYCHRPDFPVRPVPPWTTGDVAMVKSWQAGLQADRARDADRPCSDEELAEIAAMIERVTGKPYAEWVESGAREVLRLAADFQANLRSVTS
jgi:hypothetical protein